MRGLPLVQDCRRCPVLVANRRQIVHTYGGQVPPEPGKRVLFVGEAPGYKGGDLTGVPFTRDRSGVRLQRVLGELGLSEEQNPRAERPYLRCWVGNVVRCNPPANRTPTRSEIDNCLPYLWAEIDTIRPDIVVAIGNVAVQAIAPAIGRAPQPISRIHAQVWAGPRFYVVPMKHPARISNAHLAQFVAVMQDLLGSRS